MTNLPQGATALSVACGTIEPPQTDFFRPMGFSNSNYYFYSPQVNLPVKIKAGQFKAPFMFKLAPLSWWLNKYPTTDKRSRTGVNWSLVANDLMNQCHQFGEFKGAVPAKDIPVMKWAGMKA